MENCPKEFLTFNNVEISEKKYYDLGISNKEFLKDYPTFENYLEENYEKDEETNLYGYWENPNAKWDWYEIGGRWRRTLKLKNGQGTNSDKLKNINLDSILDFQHVLKDGIWYESGEVGWWATTSATENDEKEFTENFQDKFLKGLSGETLLTLVDCHI